MSNSTQDFPKKKVQSEKVKILLFCGHSRSFIAKIFYNLCTEAAKIKEELKKDPVMHNPKEDQSWAWDIHSSFQPLVNEQFLQDLRL